MIGTLRVVMALIVPQDKENGPPLRAESDGPSYCGVLRAVLRLVRRAPADAGVETGAHRVFRPGRAPDGCGG
ncbi:hypothetical protein GCM10009744_34340 [Kribbella alba]|uniref:Uncharacterized protein n=1 Tax=Kribbella alba TaxID=190197 RepID=A0ABN2FD67_9ACTN